MLVGSSNLLQSVLLRPTGPHAASSGTVTVQTASWFQRQTSTANNAFDVGSGANRALLVAVIQETGSLSATAVTYNGTTVSALAGANFMFGLANPASGSNTLSVTFSGGGEVAIAALAVNGADQTGGSTTFHNLATNSGTDTKGSVSVTSAVGEIIMAAYISAPGVSFTTPVNGTDIGTDNHGGNGVAAHYDSGAASVNMQYNFGGSQFFIADGVSIKAA